MSKFNVILMGDDTTINISLFRELYLTVVANVNWQTSVYFTEYAN